MEQAHDRQCIDIAGPEEQDSLETSRPSRTRRVDRTAQRSSVVVFANQAVKGLEDIGASQWNLIPPVPCANSFYSVDPLRSLKQILHGRYQHGCRQENNVMQKRYRSLLIINLPACHSIANFAVSFHHDYFTVCT